MVWDMAARHDWKLMAAHVGKEALAEEGAGSLIVIGVCDKCGVIRTANPWSETQAEPRFDVSGECGEDRGPNLY
jgi:hypothetical protein